MGIKYFGKVLKERQLGRSVELGALDAPVLVDLDNLLHKFWQQDSVGHLDSPTTEEMFQYIYQQRFTAVWERLDTLRDAFAARNQKLVFISRFNLFGSLDACKQRASIMQRALPRGRHWTGASAIQRAMS